MVTSPSTLTSDRYSLAPIVDFCLPLRGNSFPADHNYGLYAALVHLAPEFREMPDLAIHTAAGLGDGQGVIRLAAYSHLTIRAPMQVAPVVYRLAGKTIRVGKHEVQLGIPKVSMLSPVARLKARIVTIKATEQTNTMEPEGFLKAAQRQLERMSIKGNVNIPKDSKNQYIRKTLKIKTHTIVGFTTVIEDLSEDDSLKLQAQGLGGRRHMGCGFFLPA
ncbi:MAG: type I-MYXAN CRISPR-associated protein Cas6/Cmx6 [Gloeomargaritaceae cyanobacterium C42_A2020_066]|nr:type I-MYXAN CRISPR-associated protein Cas6/Cmx6 [Gloeomargaritaceae cyanobacterium C42_A2020_066]